MEKTGTFSAYGYGMAIISTELFIAYLKEKKCKAKKMITYFDKNQALFFDFILAGRLLPLYQISTFEYEMFGSVDDEDATIPVEFSEVYRYDNLYIEVGKLGRICFACFDYLEYPLADIKQNITDKENITPTGAEGILEKYFPAIGFDLQERIYEFDLIGMERKQKRERESQNFGFAFVFRKNADAINENFTKANNGEHNFDIISFKN